MDKRKRIWKSLAISNRGRPMFARTLVTALAALAFAAAPAVHAQDKWPSKPVTVIVPFAAGGNTDVLGRIFAERLSARLGQQFVIENKAGAGGVTGVAQALKATPDGYTIAVATGSGLAYNPVIMGDKMPYDVDKDVYFLYNMANQPNLLVVHPSVPAKTLPELVAWLKEKGETPYATSGIGSSQHLCGEALAQAAGVKLAAVAYRASNQIMQDLIGGQILLACDNFATAWEQVKGDKLRAIAVTSVQPYAVAPSIPTVASTYPGFDILALFGFVAPVATPKAITDKLIEELTAIGNEPETKKRLEGLGVEPSGLSGDAYKAFMRKQRDNIKPVVEKAGIKM
jgi:tripartite-type tricarboxylate transporter receptor subunit TctC